METPERKHLIDHGFDVKALFHAEAVEVIMKEYAEQYHQAKLESNEVKKTQKDIDDIWARVDAYEKKLNLRELELEGLLDEYRKKVAKLKSIEVKEDKEYPCQQLQGGTGSAIYENVNGLCVHPECKPEEVKQLTKD